MNFHSQKNLLLYGNVNNISIEPAGISLFSKKILQNENKFKQILNCKLDKVEYNNNNNFVYNRNTNLVNFQLSKPYYIDTNKQNRWARICINACWIVIKSDKPYREEEEEEEEEEDEASTITTKKHLYIYRKESGLNNNQLSLMNQYCLFNLEGNFGRVLKYT
nr:MAG: hypothetical protein [Metapenaeopsis lamellata majanivirus]